MDVEIPDNDVLLDEQKSFEEQPVKVKAALFTWHESVMLSIVYLEADSTEEKRIPRFMEGFLDGERGSL